jgi:hypothetical protein
LIRGHLILSASGCAGGQNRREISRLQREMDEWDAVWDLLFHIQEALPCVEDGRVFGPEYDCGVSGDDLPKVRRAEAAVQELTGTVNIGEADGYRGIAARIATLRRIAYPAAWAVYEEVRAVLPTTITVVVSQDASRVRLCGVWTLGTYATDALRAALPRIAASAQALIEHPLEAERRVADLVGLP